MAQVQVTDCEAVLLFADLVALTKEADRETKPLGTSAEYFEENEMKEIDPQEVVDKPPHFSEHIFARQRTFGNGDEVTLWVKDRDPSGPFEMKPDRINARILLTIEGEARTYTDGWEVKSPFRR